MKHSFGLDVLGCPKCGARLKLRAVIRDRAEVRRLLSTLRLWSEPIPIRPARAPPDELFAEEADLGRHELARDDEPEHDPLLDEQPSEGFDFP